MYGKYDKGAAIDVSAADWTLSGNEGPRALMVGVAGDVKVDFVRGATGITLKAVAAGVIHHGLRVKKVYQTGTTATGIVLLY